MKIIETERLYLREYEDNDFDKLAEIYSDEETMKYIGKGGAIILNEKDKQKIKDHWLKCYSEWGFGIWSLIEKGSNSYIGNCGFNKLKNSDEIEIAYLLAKEYWGKGYATEISKAALEYGINKLNLKRIVAMAYPENTASINVIKKLGMKSDGEKEYRGNKFLFFSIES